MKRWRYVNVRSVASDFRFFAPNEGSFLTNEHSLDQRASVWDERAVVRNERPFVGVERTSPTVRSSETNVLSFAPNVRSFEANVMQAAEPESKKVASRADPRSGRRHCCHAVFAVSTDSQMRFYDNRQH
jgi:hypothetical protein